jgi:DNA-binding NtrC family response regulator
MSSHGKLLIVDDEDVVRDSLKDWFSAEDYEVTAVAGGKEALTLVSDHDFDLIWPCSTSKCREWTGWNCRSVCGKLIRS